MVASFDWKTRRLDDKQKNTQQVSNLGAKDTMGKVFVTFVPVLQTIDGVRLK